MLKRLLQIGGAVLALGAGVASAQVIPPNRIETNVAGLSCEITLLPSQQQGEDSPVLVLQVGVRATAGQFAMLAKAPSGGGRIQLVHKNQRAEFVGTGMRDMRATQASANWRMLTEAGSNGLPFFLTRQASDGSWASSRYEGLDPRGIQRLMEQNCELERPKTPQDLEREEQALRLTPDQMRHIRWVLNRLFGPPNAQPGYGAVLQESERGYLANFASRAGMEPTRYLNRALADRLLWERADAVRKSYTAFRNVQRVGDWVSYGDSTLRRCTVETEAQTWTGDVFYNPPRMVFFAMSAESGDLLGIEMTQPSPFNPNRPIRAIVDGKSFALDADDGRFIKPPMLRGGRDVAVIRAIRAGRSVAITGTSSRNGNALTLNFSASGFTAAFRNMMNLCRRPGLASWL